MYKTFMAGFSQQAGEMIAQIVIGTAVQTRAFQSFTSKITHQQKQTTSEQTQTIGFVQANKEKNVF